MFLFNYNLFEFLNLLGISADENSNPLVLLFCVILFFASLALLSVINISIYLLSIYILGNKDLLSKVENYPFLIKTINFYKKTRIIFIILELGLLLFSLFSIISFSYRIILKLLST